MKHIVSYSEYARDNLKKIGAKESKRIADKLDYYCTLSNPFVEASSLSGEYAGLYRFRIGKYRVIFSKNVKEEFIILYILKVGKRGEVYD